MSFIECSQQMHVCGASVKKFNYIKKNPILLPVSMLQIIFYSFFLFFFLSLSPSFSLFIFYFLFTFHLNTYTLFFILKSRVSICSLIKYQYPQNSLSLFKKLFSIVLFIHFKYKVIGNLIILYLLVLLVLTNMHYDYDYFGSLLFLWILKHLSWFTILFPGIHLLAMT